MKALIDKENNVIQVQENEFEVHPDFKWVECPNNCEYGWIYENGEVKPKPVEPMDTQQLLQIFNQAIQDFLNYKAKEKNYESSLHCASYRDSTNAQWQQEAQAFIAWRDAVWLYAYSELALIQAGEKPVPTIEEFIQSLPDLNW
ncbi:TPA: hypothetical protein NQN30_000394 [Legionella pneumophila]|nr:hypothetical protein [Legionella pneumophila]